FVVFVNADHESQSRCCRNSSNARSVTDKPRPPSSDAASHLYRDPFINSKYLLPLTLDWCAMYFRPADLRIVLIDKSRISSAALNLRSEEHTSELQSRFDLVCRLLLEQKKNTNSGD